MKKILSVLLSTAMLFSIATGLGFSAYAASTSGNLSYNVLSNGKVEITGYTGSPRSLTIPSTIEGHTVTSIGELAFADCTSLTSVIIPDSVTSIGDSAFNACINLTNITIPKGVKSIGASAFNACTKLTNVTKQSLIKARYYMQSQTENM